jgi:hypothetical protein
MPQLPFDYRRQDFSWVYAGCLDIAHGTQDLALVEAELKLLSLFFDKVIVFDNYLTCIGPAWGAFLGTTDEAVHLARTLRSGFRDGVFVVANREAVPPKELWERACSAVDSGKEHYRGIAPGRFLSLPKSEGRQVLGELVGSDPTWVAQPSSLEGSSESYRNALLVTLREQRDAVDPDAARILADWIEAQARGFRRGGVEGWVADRYSLAPREIYDIGRTHPTADWLLRTAATVYQANHAAKFKMVGGLYLRLEPRVLVNGAFDDDACEGPRLAIDLGFPPRERSATLALDLQNLTWDEITLIRKSDRFQEYISRLRNVVAPPPGKRFIDVDQNAIFLRELAGLLHDKSLQEDCYLRFLVQRLAPRESVEINPVVKQVLVQLGKKPLLYLADLIVFFFKHSQQLSREQGLEEMRVRMLDQHGPPRYVVPTPPRF